jgi:hypothetical protein
VQYTKSVNVRHAVVIDDNLFKRLDPILEELREGEVDRVAANNKIPTELISATRAGEVLDAVREFSRNGMIKDLAAIGPSVSISFVNGIDVSASSLAEAIAALDREPSSIQRMTIRMGGYSGTRLTIEARPAGYVHFQVTGEERAVNHFSSLLVKAFANAEPEYAFLRTKAVASITAIAAGLLCLFTLAVLWAATETYIGKDFREFFAVGCAMASFVFGSWFHGQYEKAFPRSEFPYASGTKKASARRALYLPVATIVVIPLAKLVLSRIGG